MSSMVSSYQIYGDGGDSLSSKVHALKDYATELIYEWPVNKQWNKNSGVNFRLEEGITNCYGMFSEVQSFINCTSILSSLPSTVTDCSFMFAYSNLGSALATSAMPIELSNNIKSCRGLFRGANVTNINVPFNIGANISDLSYMFAVAVGNANINIDKINILNQTPNLSHIFQNMNVVNGTMYVNGTANLSYAFCRTRNIYGSQIRLLPIDRSSDFVGLTTDLSYAFAYHNISYIYGLINATLDYNECQNVNTVAGIFSNCEFNYNSDVANIKHDVNILFSNFPKLDNMSYAFSNMRFDRNCTNVSNNLWPRLGRNYLLEFPSTVTNCHRIFSGMFTMNNYGTGALPTSIGISNHVIDCSYMFENLNFAITSVFLDENMENCQGMFSNTPMNAINGQYSQPYSRFNLFAMNGSNIISGNDFSYMCANGYGVESRNLIFNVVNAKGMYSNSHIKYGSGLYTWHFGTAIRDLSYFLAYTSTSQGNTNKSVNMYIDASSNVNVEGMLYDIFRSFGLINIFCENANMLINGRMLAVNPTWVSMTNGYYYNYNSICNVRIYTNYAP